ncbi:MAG: hypothetical protein M1379_13130 [Firmicutes bacterium]|nr:hypothetical protein [Bacillota bacterium]
MQAFIGALKKTLVGTWENLWELILVNLLWLLSTMLVVTAGPGLLAIFHLTTQMAGEKQYRILDFWTALVRFFRRGLGVMAVWAFLLLVIYSNVLFYRNFSLKWVAALAGGLWFYLLLFFLMMQPYWLWWMTAGGKGLWWAARAAAWEVLANPGFSILQLVVVALVFLAVGRWVALLFLIAGGFLALLGANMAREVPLSYHAAGETTVKKQDNSGNPDNPE